MPRERGARAAGSRSEGRTSGYILCVWFTLKSGPIVAEYTFVKSTYSHTEKPCGDQRVQGRKQTPSAFPVSVTFCPVSHQDVIWPKRLNRGGCKTTSKFWDFNATNKLPSLDRRKQKDVDVNATLYIKHDLKADWVMSREESHTKVIVLGELYRISKPKNNPSRVATAACWQSKTHATTQHTNN